MASGLQHAKQIPLTCNGHTRPVVHLDFSDMTPSGYYLISACKDGAPMLRKGDTGDWIGTFTGHKGCVWGCALSSDASKAATGAADMTAKVWDCNTGDVITSIDHMGIVRAVDFSLDNQYLLTATHRKQIQMFDLMAPECPILKFEGFPGIVRHAKFSMDGSKIVATGEEKDLRIYDKISGEMIKRIALPSPPASFDLSRDGSVLTISCGKTVSFWDMHRLDLIKEIHFPSVILSSTLHPGKTVVVAGGEDFKMYKYDYQTGTELESFKGHFGPVHSVRFSPDGHLYASGSEDGTVRLWQTVVGQTYGLWKWEEEGGDSNCTGGDSLNTSLNNSHIG